MGKRPWVYTDRWGGWTRDHGSIQTGGGDGQETMGLYRQAGDGLDGQETMSMYRQVGGMGKRPWVCTDRWGGMGKRPWVCTDRWGGGDG